MTDVRGILTGVRYRDSGLTTVFVSSVDDIAPLFDNTRTTFPLTIDNDPVDATRVTAQNMFVSLGGVMQCPIAQAGDPKSGLVYNVQVNPVSKAFEIVFSTPPLSGLTCNIRVVTSFEILTCPLPDALQSNTLRDGPGVGVNNLNQITDIDSGLVN